MPHKSKEDQKKYREEHKERIRETNRKYHETHKESLAAYNAAYRLNHGQEINKKNVERRFHRRMQIIEILGGKCNWPGCDWSDYRALQVDHINGGGHVEIRKIGFDGVIRNVLNGNSGYQLLCANHNSVKRHENGEWRK